MTIYVIDFFLMWQKRQNSQKKRRQIWNMKMQWVNMIRSDMRVGMSQACKYSVGWHGLLFPSMRGMGGEQKFLLFVCVCAPPPCAYQSQEKNGFLWNWKTFYDHWISGLRPMSRWVLTTFLAHWFCCKLGDAGARSRGTERAAPGSSYSPSPRLFKATFFPPSQKWGMVNAIWFLPTF